MLTVLLSRITWKPHCHSEMIAIFEECRKLITEVLSVTIWFSASIHLVRESFKTGSDGVPTTEFGRLESPYDILESGRYHKVLLFQTQLFPFKELRSMERNVTIVDICKSLQSTQCHEASTPWTAKLL